MYSVSYYKIMVFHISDIVWERFRLVYDTVKFLNDITPLKDWITPGSQLLQGAAKVVLVVSPGRLDSLYRRHKLNKTCGCLKGVKEAIPRCPWQAQLSKDTHHTHTHMRGGIIVAIKWKLWHTPKKFLAFDFDVGGATHKLIVQRGSSKWVVV